MFSQKLFSLVQRLIFSRWARNCEEHHGPYEDVYVARLGVWRLEINHCFVLDHQDACISVRLPTPRGQLHLGYVVCLGADKIRRPGCYVHWQKSLLRLRSAQVPQHRSAQATKVVTGQARQPTDDDEYPF